jgi:hypothetical protein
MKKEQTTEGNKVIDLFNNNLLYSRGFSVEEYNYNSEWNNLMTVICKIESLPVNWNKSGFNKEGYGYNGKKDHRYEVRIEGINCEIIECMCMVGEDQISLPHNDPYYKFDKNITKIESVWITIVEFIKWYY